jgi:predicted PurR-regulated permease PerM
MAAVLLAIYLISSYIKPFFCGVAIAYTMISRISKLISYQPMLSKVRGRILIKGSYDDIS